MGRRCPSTEELGQLAQVWLRVNAVHGDKLWLSRGYDQSLHSVEGRLRGYFQMYMTWATAEFPQGLEVAEQCLSLLEGCRSIGEELLSYEPVLCFCRSDPRLANVIQRPDGHIGLVDWEDSGLRDPARDLADLLTHPNQEDLLTFDTWQAFLQPYLATRGAVDPQLERRMELYLAIFPLDWLATLMSSGSRRALSGQPTRWLVNGLPLNQRLQRYLARALAWPQMDVSHELASVKGVEFFPMV